MDFYLLKRGYISIQNIYKPEYSKAYLMKKIEKGGIQGATFGVMEASIMMIGVLLGLSVTGNRYIISLGMLSAGIADAIANSASFYVSEESEMIHTKREIFKAAWLCFISTLLTVLAVTAPVLFVKNLGWAIVSSFAIGLVILFFLGNYMAKKTKQKNVSKAIIKYIVIGFIAAFICFFIGKAVTMMAAAPPTITFK